jgi:5-methyltetrahydropteroyltriglutamate--homocysteine methyltransferase
VATVGTGDDHRTGVQLSVACVDPGPHHRESMERPAADERPRLPTTVVGSYPQPNWLIDRDRLGERLPPRVRARELWRVPEPYLEEAQDDATRLAVRDMERAGVDVITDGEMRRESYSNRFATALDGVDLDRPGVALDRTGHENPVPRVVGPIRRTGPVEVRDVEFLRAITDRRIKITVPGPFTMTQQAQNDHYRNDRSLALAYADAVNEELRDLKRAGADVVQIDEPYLQARPEAARAYAIEAIDRALEGIEGETVLHTCFGYAHIVHDRPSGYPFLRELDDCAATHLSLEAAQPNLDPNVLRELRGKTIVLGVLDLGSDEVETADAVAARIRRALEVIPPERLVVAPDCGMKYLPRERAFGKLAAMVAGARLVRGELTAR